MTTLILLLTTLATSSSVIGDELTTPFATFPGLTTQQVLRTLLPYDVIPYTPVVAYSSGYRSKLKSNARGMEHLYRMTHMFLDVVEPYQAVPPGVELSTNPNDMLRYTSDWQLLVQHYAGIAATAAAGILLAALIPLVGLFVCCCRCAGRCGGKEEPIEKRRDKCKRVFLGILLGALLLLIAFGVICAFVSNSNVEEGTKELPQTLRSATHDASAYLNATKHEFQTLLITNYRQLETALNKALNDSGDMVVNELKSISQAVAVDNLTFIASTLVVIRLDLQDVISNTTVLEANSRPLQSGLNDIKDELKRLISKCRGHPSCERLASQYDVDSLAVDRYFEKLPNVQRIAANISRLIQNGVEREVRRGQESFQQASSQIHQTVASESAKLKLQMRDSGETLTRTSNDISVHLARLADRIESRELQGSINTLQAYIDDYGQYRFYLDIAMASLVLLMLLCFAFGLSCGCCGKRPVDRFDDEFGSKATGASCLMAGTGLFFLTSFFLLVLTTAHFLVGSVGDIVACDVLANTRNNASDPYKRHHYVYDFVDRTFPLDAYYPSSLNGHGAVTVSSFLRDCHGNSTLFKALQLEDVFNLTAIKEYPQKAGIDQLINRLESELRLDLSFQLLSDDAKRQLRDFANSELLKINFTEYSILLDRDITSVNLLEMAASLNKTALEVLPFDRDSANKLLGIAVRLENLQATELSAMKGAAGRLRHSASQLEEHIKFNQSSLAEAIEVLIGQAEAAETFLQSQGPQQLSQLTVAFAKEFKRHIEEYIDRLSDHVQNKVGKCWPVSQAYNTTAGALCHQISDPFNGFWVSVGWCLLLFLPCVFISLTLSSLYRKTDPYPGGLLETEFLYDAYADRDNIPLAIANSRENRRAPPYSASRGNGQPYNVYSGYESDYGPPYSHSSRSGGASVAPAERNGKTGGRYQDAAPRAWTGNGSSSNGAPRYSASPARAASSEALNKPSAPSDFERPPPYYYPGPANVH